MLPLMPPSMPLMAPTSQPSNPRGTNGLLRRWRAVRGGLRLRLTLLSTALLALISGLILALAYLLVSRVLATVPRIPPGLAMATTPNATEGIDVAELTERIISQGRQTVLLVGAIALPLIIIAGFAVSWTLIGRALRPLSTLTRTAKELSESSLDQRISLQGPRDEVAELADTFDEMLGRLQAAFEAERRFVANASHELRTPMSVIRTEIDVTLADPEATKAELREMGEVAREAVDRADRLLTSLLFLARTQAGGIRQRKEVDLALLVAPALRAVEGEILGKQLHPDVDTDPAPVTGDPALLERVLGNLVENAVRHNVIAGPMIIRTGSAGDRSWITVTSGGAVIDPKKVAELFEPFRQGERARTGRTGSGLGLSIVRAVVAAHDGAVTAQAVPGGGLAVRVELPTRTAGSQPTSQPTKEALPPRAG